MHAPAPAAAPALVSDLRRVFGSRLRAVVAYGPHLEGRDDADLTSLALVTTLTIDDLEACASLAGQWAKAGVSTPLILPEDEFRGSLDAFPLEYGEIIRTHVLLFGDDPFAGTVIQREDLRRACETQIKSHLVHLREQFIETRGTPREVSELVRVAAPALAALLRNVARLGDVHTRDRLEATQEGARLAALDDHTGTAVLESERPNSTLRADHARLFPAYLAAVEQLARAVDAWRG